MKMFLTTYPAVALLLSLVLVGGTFLGGAAVPTFLSHGSLAATPSLVPANLALDPTIILGKAAIIYDPATGAIIFSKNATVELPLASLTKLMTAEVVLARIPPNTRVQISESDISQEGDWGFRPGDSVSLFDLLKISLVASSNDAIAAAAATVGPGYLAAMNQKANDLGLLHTYFLNPTGLDIDTEHAGAYSSAYDVARLAAVFYKQHPQFFELTQNPSISIQAGNHTLSANATAAPILDLAGFVGAKTGYTDLAGGNLVAIFDADIGHPLVAVVLGSTPEGRFDDIRTLIGAVRSL